jgi:hypothetical protein
MCEVFILAPTDLVDDEETRDGGRRSPIDRSGAGASRATALGGRGGRRSSA